MVSAVYILCNNLSVSLDLCEFNIRFEIRYDRLSLRTTNKQHIAKVTKQKNVSNTFNKSGIYQWFQAFIMSDPAGMNARFNYHGARGLSRSY